MYAENNFYDNNLDASGSAQVTVHGNMTAGNQVLINRDYGTQHSKLAGPARPAHRGWLAGAARACPVMEEALATPWEIAAWREVPPPRRQASGGGCRRRRNGPRRPMRAR